MSSTPSVLFICVKNGGKSQMAAALMRQRAAGEVQVSSAGTRPGDDVNALSAQVVAEFGASMQGARPRAIDPEQLRAVDRVVLVGGEAVVDAVNGMRGSIETWDIDEPSERGVEGVERMRLVRDDINAHVQDLYRELTRTTTSEAPL